MTPKVSVHLEPDAKGDEPALAPRGARERELVVIIRELVQELHPQRAKIIEVFPSSRLERDLGIDSLHPRSAPRAEAVPAAPLPLPDRLHLTVLEDEATPLAALSTPRSPGPDGSFLAKQKQEIIDLARNRENAEREDHPLQRIMSIKEDGDTLVIMTTDIHLPRRIGHAIVDAYKGDLDTHYDREGYFVRIKWRRD